MGWGWRERPREHAPELAGDIDGIVDAGLYTRVELERASLLLTSGFPPKVEIVAEWRMTPGGILVTAEAEGCLMEQTFEGPRDNLHVVYDSFLLPPSYQDSGFGSEMVRGSLTLYDELGVKTVHTQTYRGGNKMWAWFRAYPRDPQGEGTALLEHIQTLHQKGRLATADAAVLWQIVEDALQEEPEHVMYRVACYVDNKKEIGAKVLSGFSWGAMWRLTDEVQRSLIAQALSTRRPS